MDARTCVAADLDAVERSWAEAFPGGGSPDLATAVAEGRCLLVLGQGAAGPVTAVVLSSTSGQLPGERRLVVAAGGTAAWEAAERAARRWVEQQGVPRWHVVVREDDAVPVAALTSAGYEVTARSWGAALRVADADAPALRRRVEVAREAGFVVRRLGDQDAAALHGLLQACREDFPHTPATAAPDPSLEEVAGGLADGRVVAHGASTGSGELVAATAVELSEGMTGVVADVDQTVVARAARRRGLATAVKALSVLELGVDAGPGGAVLFRTGGAQANEGSLRANLAVGYELEPLWLTWTATPADGPAG